jgi:hypothetical protein
MVNIIVENGYNTSYISTLLIALFFNNTYLEDLILSRYLNNQKNIYLQEIIKLEIIDKIKHNNSILSDSINKIRMVSHLLGWQKTDSMFNNHNILEYYQFLLHKCEALTYCTRSIKSNKLSSSEIGNTIHSITHINITPNLNTSIINEFHSNINMYFHDSYFETTIIKDKYIQIPVIRLRNLFPLFTFYINRDNINNLIEIEKKFKIKYLIGDSIINVEWIFHALIGFNKVYYTLINVGKKWYVFSDNLFPSFKEVNMSNPKVINKIKSEVVMVMYRTKFC